MGENGNKRNEKPLYESVAFEPWTSITEVVAYIKQKLGKLIMFFITTLILVEKIRSQIARFKGRYRSL